MTIAVAGVMAVGLANLLQHPMNGYAAVSRRAELVALGDLATRRMIRDLSAALPNSVRISAAGDALEFLLVSTGGRYRAAGGINPGVGGGGDVDHTSETDRLSFGGDTHFNLLGRLPDSPFTYGSPLPRGTRIAIYPTSADLWNEAARDENPAVISPSTTRITVVDDTDEDQLQLSASHTFRLESPSARVYLVETPVSYLCEAASGSLWRIDGYPVALAQPTNRATSPLAAGRIARSADRVETCRFSYRAGTASRAGLVTIEIALAARGERIRLLRQVQVQNAP